MIEALSLWLQKIILVVLIATFLDMLLPNSGMQRYVRMVMGLLILLTIISPILEIVKKDLTAEKIAMRIMKLNSGATQNEWEQMKQYSERLMQQSELDTQEFVQVQLQDLIRAKVEEDYGVRVSSVQVNFGKEKNKEQEYPVISSVQLVLDKDIQATRPEDGGNLKIQPIEPVTISVNGETSGNASTVSTSPELSAAERKLLTDIEGDIANTWSIDRSQVTAKVEGKHEEG